MSCKSWWRRGDDNLTGTSGRDWLFGGRGNNTVDGRGGNDFIWVGRGNDVVDGGDGRDWIWSGGGEDVVNGGDGNDRIWSGRGNDDVDGGAGHDRIRSGRGDDDVRGGDGNDRIWSGRGNDIVDGGAGYDRIRSGRGDDDVHGGDGNDRIWSGRGNDVVDGGDGDDRIKGGRGDDILNGGAGSDKVYAGSGDDTGIYLLSEHSDSKDYYNGGRGTDVLILQMTHAEHTAEVQADLDAFEEFLAQPGNGWKYQSFQFKAFDLKVKNWESYRVEYTDTPEPDTARVPSDTNVDPEAVDDVVSIAADTIAIQEVESNDPDGNSLTTTAQVIERSSFRIAPSTDVGDDSLHRVSIAGTIAGPLPVTGPNANDVDVFAITLQAGEKLILDIDHAFVPGSPMNAQLFLMDDSGKVIAENDDPVVPPGSTISAMDLGGGGSVSPLDPYLEYTDSGSGGTYYVAVSTWNNDPLGSSTKFNDFGFVPGDYVLNISIDNAAPDLGGFVIAPDTLLANDVDADGDLLTVTSVGNAVNGTVELTGTGEILFKPDIDAPGSFDYTVSDGNGAESVATVTVNGNPIVGTALNDSLTGTSGDDLFVGLDGSDTFNFARGFGNDTIADFTVGSDELIITDAMSVDRVQPVDNGVLVTFDTDESVLLVGVPETTGINDLFP